MWQKNILKGEKFSKENLTCKRPGNGISPMLWNKLIGKKSKKIILLMNKSNLKNVALITTSRADYSILRNLIFLLSIQKK